MSTRRTPPRGASRSPRQAPSNRARGGATSRGGKTASTPGKPAGSIRKGRLVLALLVLAGLGALIWHVTHRQSNIVATVPPALADDKPGKNTSRQPQDTTRAGSANSPERFEFYDILPNQQVLPTRTPENRPTPRPQTTQPNRQAASAGEAAAPRWLQVGAFRSAAEADRRRAQIRLLGLPARTQAGVDGQGLALQRVLAGPFNAPSSLEAGRRTLAAAGLDAIPLNNSPENPMGEEP